MLGKAICAREDDWIITPTRTKLVFKEIESVLPASLPNFNNRRPNDMALSRESLVAMESFTCSGVGFRRIFVPFSRLRTYFSYTPE